MRSRALSKGRAEKLKPHAMRESGYRLPCLRRSEAVLGGVSAARRFGFAQAGAGMTKLLLNEGVELLEFRRAGALEPLEDDHLAVDDIGTFLGEPGHGAL